MDKKLSAFLNSRVWLPALTMLILFIVIPVIYKPYDDEFPQIYIYCLIASLMGLMSIRNIFNDHIRSFEITNVDVIVIFLVAYTVIYQIIFSHYVDWIMTSRIMACSFIFIFIRTIGKSKEEIKSLFDLLICFGLIESTIALMEVLKVYSFFPGSIHLINGTFKNPNVVAIFLVLLVPISVFRYKTAHRKKFIYVLFSSLFILIIILCKCRSAIIFLIISLFIFVLSNLSLANIKRLIITVLVIAALLFSLVVIWGNKKGSNTSRKLIWEISWEMIKEKPFMGYGLANFEREYNLYQANYLKNKPADFDGRYATGYIRQPYNEFFYFWLTGGILYLSIYLSLGGIAVFFLIKSLKEKQELIVFTSVVSLVSLFFISLFSYSFYVPAIEFFLFMHLGVIANYIPRIKAIAITKQVSIMILSLSVAFIGAFSFKQLIADYRVSKAIQFLPLAKQIKVFEEYLAVKQTDPQFLFNYALALSKEKRFNDATLKLELAKKYSSYYQIYYGVGMCYEMLKENELAEENYLTAAQLCPQMFKPRYALFKYYLKEGKIKKARAVALEIKKMPVKINSDEIKRIRNEARSFLTPKNQENEHPGIKR